MNIYVSNLSYSTDADSLQQLFSEYGDVKSANVITDRETGRSRGFGFVEMPDETEGQRAIDELNETELDGKTISVSVARPKTDKRNDGGFNRGGGSNRGGGGSNRGGSGGGYNRGGSDGYNRGGGGGGGYKKNRY
ncbi:MAG: RNA-binding protein [Prevotellaceae bacterium]|jgi:RNA recognition motif-containing protein|nr:RNA-binding protein [Prevotellaceae bacterium]